MNYISWELARKSNTTTIIAYPWSDLLYPFWLYILWRFYILGIYNIFLAQDCWDTNEIFMDLTRQQHNHFKLFYVITRKFFNRVFQNSSCLVWEFVPTTLNIIQYNLINIDVDLLISELARQNSPTTLSGAASRSTLTTLLYFILA